MRIEEPDTTNQLRKTNKTSDVHSFVPDSKFEIRLSLYRNIENCNPGDYYGTFSRLPNNWR